MYRGVKTDRVTDGNRANSSNDGNWCNRINRRYRVGKRGIKEVVIWIQELMWVIGVRKLMAEVLGGN